MGILLLSECLPYRNVASDSFDNSQGRLLATMANLTVRQLEQVADCRYVIPHYVGPWQKTARYVADLEKNLKALLSSYKQDHKKRLTDHVIFLVGKRMANLLGFKQIEFWEIHFYDGMMFYTLPNPLAEYWWKEETNVKQTKLMMGYLFTRWTQ